jgi:uncharacterized SAM-binding protein YcdF (DUF218 family)
MGPGIGGLLEQLISPPGGFILLSLLGLALLQRYRRVAIGLITSGLVLLYVASLPVTARVLMAGLEPNNALSEKKLLQENKPPQAIVILGAGRRYNTPEFGEDTPNAFALERIRYGVWLARRSMLPVLVSGGLGDEKNPPEAEMAKQIIENEYALPVRWVENKSRTTYENAQYSAELLKAEGIDSIYLVTHALHMRRSVMSFEKFGFTVQPAPTAFEGHNNRSLAVRSYLPSARAQYRVAQVFHEWLGLLWYQLRY